MAYRRARGDLIEVYKIIHEIYDSKTTGNILKLRDKIQLSLRGHNYILEHKRLYNPMRVNYFTNRVVNNWNSLPECIVVFVETGSLNIFKNSLDRLSKRRENACLILFHKIINNLAMVPHSCLEKADGRTRKNHNLKFRHIGYNVDPYGQSFFPKCISAWNGLAQEIAEANTLDLFKSKLAH